MSHNKFSEFCQMQQGLHHESNYVNDFAKMLIDRFETVACVTFINKESLIKQIGYHIKPMIFRLKYGIKLKNPLLDDISHMFPEIFVFTALALKGIRNELTQLITDDEIAYLCIYIASHLKNVEVSGDQQKNNKILILCGAGMATSVLLKDQLQTLLGNSFSYDLAMADNINANLIKDYLFVVSTAKLKKEHRNVIYTSLILSDQNKQSIIRIIKEQNITSKWGVDISAIIQVVNESTEYKLDETKLFFDLFCLYSRNNNIRFFSTKSEIKINSKDCHLVEGSPFEIAQGFLLYHSNSNQNTTKHNISLSLSVNQNSSRPHPYDSDIILQLTTIDNYSHFSFLALIYQYFNKQKNQRDFIQRVRENGETPDLILGKLLNL